MLRLYPEAAEQLRAYVARFVEQQHPDIRDDESMAAIGALLELAGHKNPRMRVLELSGDAQGYKAKQWQSILGKETAFSRCRSWHTGDLTEDGEVSIKDEEEGPFDVVVIPKVCFPFFLLNLGPQVTKLHPKQHATLASEEACASTHERLTSLISEQGIVIARKSDSTVANLHKAGFDVLDIGKQVLLAIRPLPPASLQDRKALILVSSFSVQFHLTPIG